MYATKEALIIKEHHPEIDVAVFYIDIRAFGKGFEAYYERALKAGVRYIRCQPSSLKQIPGNKETPCPDRAVQSMGKDKACC